MNMLSIAIPKNGQTNFVVRAGQALVFSFDVNTASFSRSENSLVIESAKGGKTVLEDFFVTGKETKLPSIELTDGSTVAAEEFLQAMNPDMDLTTAAGPASASSSGLSNYSDGSGDLISGVSRLDDLDSSPLTSTTLLRGEPATGKGLLTAAAGVPGIGETGPETGPTGPETGPTGPETGPTDPEPGPTPLRPDAYANIAILDAKDHNSGSVHVNLGILSDGMAVKDLYLTDFNGNKYPAIQHADGTVTFDLNGYTAVYDPVRGELVFTLSDGVEKAIAPENYTVVIVDNDGLENAFGVRVASSEEHNSLNGIIWKTPEDPSIEIKDQTWAADRGAGTHYQNAAGSEIADTIKLPEAPEGEPPYESGREMHYQIGESSLTAVDGFDSSVQFTLGSADSSIRISNNDDHMVIGTVQHTEPLAANFLENVYNYNNPDIDYSASVTASAAAAGEGSKVAVTVSDGSLILQTDATAPSLTEEATAAYVSGAYAHGGASVQLEAGSVSVGASSGLAQPGDTVMVTGVRSDSAVYTGQNGYSDRREADNAEVTVKATTGDVSVSAELTGSSTIDYVNTSLAGAAATDGGQVTLASDQGNVNIDVDNRVTGGGTIDAAGMYGIFSGSGFGVNDMAERSDMEDPYSYSQYLGKMYHQYLNDKYSPKGGGWYNDYDSERGAQTKVIVDAFNDVNVNLNLGAQNGSYEASGIKGQFGDIAITTASGDINVNVTMQGAHTGENGNWVSAMEVSNGQIKLDAGGDVNLHVDANGERVAVMNYNQNFGMSYLAVSQSGESPAVSRSFYTSSIEGENVSLSGSVGANGTSDVNTIIGLNATYAVKKEAFIVKADEKFTIDVTAFDNGGTTTATGLGIEEPQYPGERGTDISGVYVLGLDAKEVEIAARVVDTGQGLSDTSHATGIDVLHHNFYLFGADEENRMYGGERGYLGHLIWGGQWQEKPFIPTGALTVSAEGARYNTGILATKTVHQTEDYNENHGRTRVDISAESLTVKASGGAADGISSSIGISAQKNYERIRYFDNDGEHYTSDPEILAKAAYNEHSISEKNYPNTSHSVPVYDEYNSSSVAITTTNVNIEVDNLQRSIGIQAAGPGTSVTITAPWQHEEWGKPVTYSEPLRVVITAKVGSDSTGWTEGIALEAINGGHVAIVSSQEFVAPVVAHHDSVILNGSVNVGSLTNRGWYNPQNPHPLYAEKGYDLDASAIIATGKGNDHIELNGSLNIGKGGHFVIDTGQHNDLIVVNGDINMYDQSAMVIDGGSGNDTIMLNGSVNYYEPGTGPLPNITVSGGYGYDILVLSAPDAETFMEYYGHWFQQGALGNNIIGFEGIILQGVDMQSEAYTLIKDCVDQYNNDSQNGTPISLQVLEANTNLEMAVNAANHEFDSSRDLSGDNDLLYALFDSHDESTYYSQYHDPEKISMSERLDAALHNLASAGDGYERMLLDLAGATTDETGNPLNVALTNISTMFSNLTATDGSQTDLYIRADSSYDVDTQGWEAGETHTYNGEVYTEYVNTADESQSLYLQLIGQQ